MTQNELWGSAVGKFCRSGDIIWETILFNLERKCLLNTSATCKKFNDLLSMSQRLTNKVSFTIKNPYRSYYITNELGRKKICRKSICKLKFMKKCLQNSERKYENIRICDLRFLNLEIHEESEKNIINAIIDIQIPQLFFTR